VGRKGKTKVEVVGPREKENGRLRGKTLGIFFFYQLSGTSRRESHCIESIICSDNQGRKPSWTKKGGGSKIKGPPPDQRFEEGKGS